MRIAQEVRCRDALVQAGLASRSHPAFSNRCALDRALDWMTDAVRRLVSPRVSTSCPEQPRGSSILASRGSERCTRENHEGPSPQARCHSRCCGYRRLAHPELGACLIVRARPCFVVSHMFISTPDAYSAIQPAKDPGSIFRSSSRRVFSTCRSESKEPTRRASSSQCSTVVERITRLMSGI